MIRLLLDKESNYISYLDNNGEEDSIWLGDINAYWFLRIKNKISIFFS